MRDARAFLHARSRACCSSNSSASRCAGKVARKFDQRFPVEHDRLDEIAAALAAQRLAEEIDRDAVAAYVDAVAVLADAIDADDVAEVLDRAGPQQRLPGDAAARRPVGDVEQQVVVAAIAAPDREAQVVADERADAPALDLDDEPPVARGVVLLLARHAEQVALVVVREAAVGRGPEQPVVVLAVRRG